MMEAVREYERTVAVPSATDPARLLFHALRRRLPLLSAADNPYTGLKIIHPLSGAEAPCDSLTLPIIVM